MLVKIDAALASALLATCLTFSVARADCPSDTPKKDTAAESTKPVPPGAKVVSASFRVKGMSCEGCGGKIKAALAKLDGVYVVDVKVGDGRVVVKYDAKKVTPDAIAKAISGVGYAAATEA